MHDGEAGLLDNLGSVVGVFAPPDGGRAFVVTGDGGTTIGEYAYGCYRALTCQILTGRYGFRTGVGYLVNSKFALDPSELTIPEVLEVSIGHALTADALFMGLDAAVRAYRAVISGTGA